MARKQLNLSLTEEQYEWLKAAAEEAELTPTRYARELVVAAVTPEPEEDPASALLSLPPWLLAVLLFLRTGRLAPGGVASKSGYQEASGQGAAD